METGGENRKIIRRRTRRSFFENSLKIGLGMGTLGWSLIEQTVPDPNAENDWGSRRMTRTGMLGFLAAVGLVNFGLDGVIYGNPIAGEISSSQSLAISAASEIDNQSGNSAKIVGQGQTRAPGGRLRF